MAARRPPAFQGRTSERQALDRLLDMVRSGHSAVLVIRGEAGVGKTALLRDCALQASGFRIAQIAGVESEMELPFAGLQQLCGPMLAQLGALPEPQQHALSVAFGLASGDAPDRFLVALAALSLLAEVAEERPLLCIVDDGQWLDGASAQVLGCVGRRLLAESVLLVFAIREPNDERLFPDLPELRLGGLPEEDARALLAAVVTGRLDDHVRDRIVAETRGNPLALLELPRGMTAAELAGGFGLPVAGDLPGQIEDHYLRRLGALPDATQRLMTLAAADPTGDATLLWRAAQTLGVGREAAAAAESEQLLEVGARVRFRHPLVRSAAYRAAPPQERLAVHRALAAVTDRQVDPDCRAWHLAAATPWPDEDVAAELERSADRAQGRGGLAAAAAFLQRSVALTPDPTRRANRALAAARANLHAGAFDEALALLAVAEAGAGDDLQRARVDLLLGQIASASRGSDTPTQLLKAARRLAPLDLPLARETYLDAWGAALFAGHLAVGANLLDVSQAARSAPQPQQDPQTSDLLLDGLAALITEGRAAATPTLRRAVHAFRDEAISVDKGLQWGVLASAAAVTLWDFDSWEAVITRQMELARAAGALTPLSIALNGEGIVVTWRGDFEAAARVTAEADAVVEATGTRIAPYGALLLAALRGREADASRLIEATIRDANAGGEGLAIQYARWTTSVLYNGLGRYEQALAAALQANDDTPELFLSVWALPELIEAAVRCRDDRLPAEALGRLAESTDATDADWGRGILARSRALVSEGVVAERCYREAVERLSRTRLRPELARAHLLYGEWLRRENRRVDARGELRAAYGMLAAMGMEAFAERARRELLATGESVRQRRDDRRVELTPQEEQISRLARDGRTNPEIGAELYLSARTVEWHLRKVFIKLDISSRKQLHGALPVAGRASLLA